MGCRHNVTHIHFAMEVPGLYRFNASDKHHCAVIGTMFKMGEQATFINMGGCPEALAGCSTGVPQACGGYTVDLGAHWELKDTQRGQAYGVNSGTGNDVVANKDDEYAVSPTCRFDDDGVAAGNEWEGAWDHSNPAQGAAGKYRFELSRSLVTDSVTTDRQLVVGGTYSFGMAFWYPYEAEAGWTDAGHFLTGCGEQWIDLTLEDTSSGPPSTANTGEVGNSAVKSRVRKAALFLVIVGNTVEYLCAMY